MHVIARNEAILGYKVEHISPVCLPGIATPLIEAARDDDNGYYIGNIYKYVRHREERSDPRQEGRISISALLIGDRHAADRSGSR